MGALLVFQPVPGSAPATAGWSAARSWLEDRLGQDLDSEAETGTGTRIAKFRRRFGDATALASSDRGILAVAGHWDHPRARDPGELLARIGQEGIAACDDLDGSFALVHDDGAELVVVTEHCGRLHVYAAETDAGVFVGTSSASLARAVGAEPDPEAVAEFLWSGTIYEDRTPFRRVRRLRGGRCYRFAAGRLAGETRLAAFALPQESPAGGGDTAGLLQTCVDATARLVEPHRRLLADLTGGLDSRLVAGLLRRSGRKFDVTVSGGLFHPDVTVAHSLARLLGCTMHHEMPTSEPLTDLAQVQRAAVLADGEIDAIGFAGVAAVKLAHAADFDGHVYGSGGEVFRNYWWQRQHLTGAGPDPVALAVPRFTGSCLDPGFLQPDLFQGPAPHFHGVIERCLQGFRGRRTDQQMDHVYLYLRMESWQGAYASAANRIWPSVCPLMQRSVLRALFALDPARRLDGRLVHDLIRRLGGDLANHPLETGFPPQSLGWHNAWRFLPGYAALPREFWRRLQGRLRRRGAAQKEDAPEVQALMAGGAAEFLAPGTLALLPFVDAAAYERFFARARAGSASRTALGRLLALETVLRG